MDHDQTNRPTKNIIAAAKLNGVERVVETSLLGLYNEVPGEFGDWNRDYGGTDRSTAGGVWFNLYPLRLPWLNDRPEVNYTLTHRHDQFVGVSGSRRSMPTWSAASLPTHPWELTIVLGLAIPLRKAPPDQFINQFW